VSTHKCVFQIDTLAGESVPWPAEAGIV